MKTVAFLVFFTLTAQAGTVVPPGWLHPYVGLGASGSFSDKFGQHKPGLHVRAGLGIDVSGPLELMVRGSWHPFDEDKWFWVKTTPGMDVYVVETGVKFNMSGNRDHTFPYLVLATGFSGYSWNTTHFNRYAGLYGGPVSDEPVNFWRKGVSVSGSFGIQFGSPQRSLSPYIELGLLGTVGREVWEYSYLLNLTFGFTY